MTSVEAPRGGINGREVVFLSDQDFREQMAWLPKKIVEVTGGDQDLVRRLDAGVNMAARLVREENFVARWVASEDFDQLKQDLEAVGGRDVLNAEVLCMDGRLIRWLRGLPREMSAFATPGGLLATNEAAISRRTILASHVLNLAISERTRVGKSIVNQVGPHTSLRHNADRLHPLGCGFHKATLVAKEQHPSQFVDGGLSRDLVSAERKRSEEALRRAGSRVVRRIIDTDTQGVVMVGDNLYWQVDNALNSGGELPLTLEVIQDLHQEGEVIYTPLLIHEQGDDGLGVGDFLRQSGYEYHSMGWNSVEDLPGNVRQIVGLTVEMMREGSLVREQLVERVGQLYSDSGLSEQEIIEVASKVAYNAAAVWLSGFDNPDNVPLRFKEHGEEFGVVGDKGFDTWAEHPPFLISNSASWEDTRSYLDVMMSLLPGIRESRGSSLDEEPIVLFVAAPVDPFSTGETLAREAGTSSFAERYRRILEHLDSGEQKLISEGKVLVVPIEVDEKTRGVVRVVNLEQLV